MNRKSDQFEILVSRVHELLEGENTIINWNKRIPDPDNPAQGRQIDVLIQKNDLITFIECRQHKQKQDVQWIEELIGRRISLNANSIIAVSASGFTAGAINKANKYGIILKDFETLSDEEISSWSKAIEISIFYYRYENFKLSFLFNSADVNRIKYNQVQKELQEYIGFNSLFTAQCNLLDEKRLIAHENRNKHVNFKVNFYIENFKISNCTVKEVEASGIAYLEEIKLNIPKILAYGSSGENAKERNVFVQNYNLGETKVIHYNGHISLTLDLSKMKVPQYWQFRFINIEGEYENYMDLFEIVNPQNLNMIVDNVDFSIVGIKN